VACGKVKSSGERNLAGNPSLSGFWHEFLKILQNTDWISKNQILVIYSKTLNVMFSLCGDS